MDTPVQPVKNEHRAHPVASAWRPTFRSIVKTFASGDYSLRAPVPGVRVDASTAAQIEAYLSDYGETLDELPDDTWDTSVSQWMGRHWDVLVDLWTVESGESDLVLAARVLPKEDGYSIEVGGVYVP